MPYTLHFLSKPTNNFNAHVSGQHMLTWRSALKMWECPRLITLPCYMKITVYSEGSIKDWPQPVVDPPNRLAAPQVRN
eukprot:451549-Karenia_brevis.AAC.1